MPKTILKAFMLMLLATGFVGCASVNQKTGGVTTRAYVAEKERVDQGTQGGNQGYLMGTAPAQAEGKKTRQVFTVEFTKETPEEETGSLIPPPKAPLPVRKVESQPVQEPEWSKPVVIPPVEHVAPKAIEEGACQEYTVQKGDTLQKIAKKFYGSYGKWARIYKANKDKLKDPDAVKVGMKLCVPGGEVHKAAPAVEEDNLK